MQSKFEYKIFKEFKLIYANLFPNPTFLSNGIVVLDRVQTIDEIFGYWSDNPVEDLIRQDLFEIKNMNSLFNFLDEIESYGACTNDILGGGNIGVIKNEIKLIDWGYYDDIKNRVFSHI